MDDRTLAIRGVDLGRDDVREGLVASVHEFMGAQRDPDGECREAIDRCVVDGIALEAVRGGERVGLAVMVRMPFDRFQPKYHLAYLATAPAARGQGIGTALLARAVAATDGELALHVKPSNEAAIAFYRRLGWTIPYLQMMPPAREGELTAAAPAASSGA